MKTQILFVLPLLISIAGATPQEEADIYHRDFQTPVEGIALGEISGETNSFGIAGVLRADGPAVVRSGPCGAVYLARGGSRAVRAMVTLTKVGIETFVREGDNARNP